MSKILKFIKPGVITGDNIQKIFTLAKDNNFALPAVNCICINSINAALETAAKVKAPIIIQFSNKGSSFMAGFGLTTYNQNITAVLGAISGAMHVHHVAPYYGVPVILHTDHCTQEMLPWLDGLLDADEKFYHQTGKTLFSSHMIDLSEKSLEENIETSSKYLTRISKLNMTLEVEIGRTGGEEDGVNNSNLNKSLLYTKVEDIAYAYEKLNSISSRFIIAASFGNIHGVYKSGNIKLIPKILDDIQKYISNKFCIPDKTLNLVFHGGSGSTLEEIKEAISYGVIKINIDTDIQWATWKGVLFFYKKNKHYLQNQLSNSKNNYKPNKKFYDPRIWIRAGQLSMIEQLENIFKKLNATNLI